MRLSILLLFAASLSLLPGQDGLDKPKNLRVSTWVREDIFAGFLDGDMARFARGVKKAERAVAADPKAADALAWLGGAELLLAVRAHEGGKAWEFEAHFAKAKAHFASSTAVVQQIPAYAEALHAIQGGSYVVMGDRLPEQHRRDAWLAVREHYGAIRKLHGAAFGKLPVHMRGEVMAGLTQAAQRLGETDAALEQTRELVAALPGTPYAVFAKRWLDKPETMSRTKMTCVTCHDPGRLQAVQAASGGN